MKNDDIENIENKFGRRHIPLQEFIQTLNNINSYNDDTVNSYITGCIFITLLEDKSYFANALLNEPSELNLCLEEVFRKLTSKRNAKSYFGYYNPQLGDNIHRRYLPLFRNGIPIGPYLDLLEAMSAYIQQIAVPNAFPIYSSFSGENVEIYFTNDPNVYKKIYLMQPESMMLFVDKYYQGNYGETVPMNLVAMCLEESYTFIQGDVSIDDIFTTISTKVLQTIELDKYDPHKSGYYTNIQPVDFSNLLYMNTVNLLKLFAENFVNLNEMGGVKYLKYMDGNKIAIWST